MESAVSNPGSVESYLMTEQQAHRIIEVPPTNTKNLQISRFGVIPKANQPGKWRLILDLSSPDGRSMNDGISPALCSMSYTTVDAAVEQILQLGKKTELAKWIFNMHFVMYQFTLKIVPY